jgi:glycosyltransferase involved in cell wall biosynthesis
MEVSVVIPTRDRPAELERCLRALATQSLAAGRYEIIVVDDAGGTDAETVVQRFIASVPVKVTLIALEEGGGPAAARNAGWHQAIAPIIAFTDDDCLPDPDWLSTGLSAFNDQVTGVRGRIVVPRAAIPSDYERTIGWLEDAEFVTANCFVRRSALEMVGGFDERFTAAWREDSDLYFTLLERGARFTTAPAVVIHPVRQAPWGVSIREQRKSAFNALLFKKHPRLYLERIQSGPPWHYYAILASLGLMVGSALGTMNPLPIVIFAALWAGLTGAFCFRRIQGTRHTPDHVTEMVVTSILIPPLSVFWRLKGALRYRTSFW